MLDREEGLEAEEVVGFYVKRSMIGSIVVLSQV